MIPKKEPTNIDEKILTPDDVVENILTNGAFQGQSFVDLEVGPDDNPPWDPDDESSRIANGEW